MRTKLLANDMHVNNGSFIFPLISPGLVMNISDKKVLNHKCASEKTVMNGQILCCYGLLVLMFVSHHTFVLVLFTSTVIVRVFVCCHSCVSWSIPSVLAVFFCFVIVFVLLLLLVFFFLFVSVRFLTLNPVSLLCPAVIDKYIEKKPALLAVSALGAWIPSDPD